MILLPNRLEIRFILQNVTSFKISSIEEIKFTLMMYKKYKNTNILKN